MNKGFFVIVGLVFFVCFCSCKSDKTGSNPKIVNGIEDKNNLYPSVVLFSLYQETTKKTAEGISNSVVDGKCSASVISHNTLLTSAHCLYYDTALPGGETVTDITVKLSSGKKVLAKSFYYNKTYIEYRDREGGAVGEGNENEQENLKEASPYDIGVVVFDNNVFSDIKPLKISNRTLEKGTKLQLVGYAPETTIGETEDTESITGTSVVVFSKNDKKVRRYGTSNSIQTSVCANGMLGFKSPFKNAYIEEEKRIDPPGINSTTWYGDSGGPALLYDDQSLIVGVHSYIDSVSNYKDLIGCDTTFSKDIVKWLKNINDTTDAVIPMDEIK